MKKENKKSEKNIHAGHRHRLIELAMNAGIDNLSEVQAVELFLTYIFPRGDVNPLAHRLLDKYQNLCNIVSASPAGLAEVPGINQYSAQRIHVFGELFYYFATSRIRKKQAVSKIADLVDIVEDYLRLRDSENLLLLSLSAGNIITHRKRIDKGSGKEVSAMLLEIAKFMSEAKTVSLVMAHCHPYGCCKPSKADIIAFEEIDKFCINCGVNLLDSYIVGEDGVYSCRGNEVLRKYADIAELTDALKIYVKK